MSKRMKRVGLCLTLCLVMMLGISTTAFAYSDEKSAGDGNGNVVVVEESITETESETEGSQSQGAQETEAHDGAFTPGGNMTLVDNLSEEEFSGLQYMTVTTKNGNYFYIIIDRSGREENVYFLNTVDAADLMALMTDEEKAQLEEETAPQEQTQPILDIEENTDAETEPEITQEPEQKSGSSLAILGVFAVIGVLVAGGYYVLKIKPKKGQTDIDVDRDFYDDEDYVNEDEEPDFADEQDEE